MPNNGPTYDHTAAGRLATRTWKRGITTAYYYDFAGDLRAVDYSDTATPDVFHTRDRLGRATTSAQGTLAVAAGTLPVATGGITVTAIRSATYGYDPATLAPATEAVDYGGGFTQTLTRTYEDGAGGTISGRPNGHTFAGGSATWTYDNTGRPSTLTDGADTFTYAYQPGSNLIKTVTGPAHTVANTYESSRDVLASKINAINDTNIPSSFSYGVNAIGQRETVGPVLDDSNNSISTYAPKWIWDYNDSGELIEANDQTASNDRAYQYDAIGNRQKTVNGLAAALPTAPTNYQANALNQYTVANGITLPIAPAPAPYDPDGNLRFDGGVNKDSENREYLWDAENRLIEVRVAGAAALVTYAYDHLSRLISRTAAGSTTHYLYDGWNRIAEYSGQTAEKTYLWGMDLSGSMQGAGGVGGLLSVSQEGSVFYPTYDGNGNVSEYITSAGAVAAHFEYDPFGNTVASNDTSNRFPYRFSTKPQDSATGLLYFGYRWYDPVTGRWPSRDPIEERGGANLYGFAGNDGVSSSDMLGLSGDLSRKFGFELVDAYAMMMKVVGGPESGFPAAIQVLLKNFLRLNNIVIETDHLNPGVIPAISGIPFWYININTNESTNTIIHEAAHLYAVQDRLGSQWDDRTHEGFASAIESMYDTMEDIFSVQMTLESDGKCSEIRKVARSKWQEAWQNLSKGVAVGQDDNGMFDLTNEDFERVGSHLNVALSCRLIASKLNNMSKCRECCMKFSCDPGQGSFGNSWEFGVDGGLNEPVFVVRPKSKIIYAALE